jgi:hypothetical protein
MVYCLAYYSTLKMKMIRSTETSGVLLITRCYDTEERALSTFILFVKADIRKLILKLGFLNII